MVQCLDGARIIPSSKGVPMNNITIGRYKDHSDKNDAVVNAIAVAVSAAFDGWIEGTRDDGSTWIMWLDAAGNPLVYFANRDESGAVEGDPVVLSPGHPYLDN